MINKENIRVLLAKKCTTDEWQQISEYLQNNPDVLNELFNEREWVDEKELDEPVPYSEAQLLQRIQSSFAEEKKNRKWISMVGWSAAAAVLLFVSLLMHFNNGKSTVGRTNVVATKTIASDSIEWVNATDTVQERIVADGSIVSLYPASSIKYGNTYAISERNIMLKGTARFNVARRAQLPFIVYSGDVSTRAIGTIFEVSYPMTGQVSVKLLQGKILVKNNKNATDSLFLKPGDICGLTGNTNKLTNFFAPQTDLATTSTGAAEARMKATIAEYVGDKKRIELKNASLPVVFDILEKMYHVHIHHEGIPDKLLKKNFYSGVIDKGNIPFEQAITIVTTVNDLNWEQIDAANYRITQ